MQTPSHHTEHQETNTNPMVVNRPRTSSPVNQQQQQNQHQVPGHTKYDDHQNPNTYDHRKPNNFDHQDPDNFGQSGGYNDVSESDNRHQIKSFQQTPSIRSQSKRPLHSMSPATSLGYQQQQQRHEPVSLLYQDLDDVIDEQGALVTSVGTMETSYLSEKSGKDDQLTHFIETVSLIFIICYAPLYVVQIKIYFSQSQQIISIT